MYYTKKSKEAQLHHLISSFILLFVLIISSSIVTNAHIVYGQTNQTIAENEDLLNMQDTPLKKVHIGDIDVAYKTFGKGDPILLIMGVTQTMDDWDPSMLQELSSSNHTVIIFDYRGVGNTTTGTKPFSIQQFANDTAGLLDALKIQKTDVFGYSMGSMVAQQLALMHPEKVNRLVLVGSTCGGQEGIPRSPEVEKVLSGFVNKTVNNTPIEPQELKNLISTQLGQTWIKLHPDFLESIPEAKDLLAGIPLNTIKQQNNIVQNWFAPNWSGICNQLPNISKPTLVITGTDDVIVPAANSLIIAGKIPGAWLVQIQGAGHALMSQYPDEFNKVLQTFLSTTTPS